jgi:small-conductance mechanosensitive channel
MIEKEIVSIWHIQLFTIGTNIVTLEWLVTLVVKLMVLFVLSSIVKRVLVKRIFVRYQLNTGVAYSTATIIRYVILIIGLMMIMQTSGFDISAFSIVFGALGIGIGFGLQNISNNFISGIIILFERPVKVGDRVELEGVAGTILRISPRATTIVTNDEIAIIVPNSDIINKNVTNWSLNDSMVRFNFPVGVSYNEDPLRVQKILLEIALNCEGVHHTPEPDVLMDEFADSALMFNLRVWSTEYSSRPRMLKSMLYYAILDRFRQEGISIPFPQRDLHIIDPLPLPVNPKNTQ